MNRRSFLTGLFGVAGATIAAAALAPAAQAAQAESLLDTLQGMDAGKIANPLVDEADLIAEGAQETQFYFGRRRVVRRVYRPVYRPVFNQRVIVRRRPRCVWVRNRFGRLIRRCF